MAVKNSASVAAARSQRILVFGNTNNFPNLLADGLRNLGHFVIQVISRTDLLHRPEGRSPALHDNYPEWIIDRSSLRDEDYAWQTPALFEMLSELQAHDYDMAILNDLGPSLAEWLPVPTAVLLTGSDLTSYASYDLLRSRTMNWAPSFRQSLMGRELLDRYAGLVTRQRRALLSADLVSFAYAGLIPEGDRLLDEIGVQPEQRFMLQMAETIQLSATPLPPGDRLKIISGCRTTWRGGEGSGLTSQDLKGTDILLRGYALYRQRGGNARLSLVRKGVDVQATNDLIKDLGLARKVTWLKEMTLDEYRAVVAHSHIVCDQLANSCPGMVTLDALAQGRPVLANFRPDIFGRYQNEPYPGLQASSPEEVCEQLQWADGDRDGLAELGRQSRAYAETVLSPQRAAASLVRKLIGE
ncbi:MAG: hypothetical protein HOP95_05930 [Sphingomonas sp.]|nr:hypothetical protein [Sphingomonas sp.]